MGSFIWIYTLDFSSPEQYLALLWLHRAADGLQYRGLAGPISAKHNTDITFPDRHADTANRHNGAVVGFDIGQIKN